MLYENIYDHLYRRGLPWWGVMPRPEDVSPIWIKWPVAPQDSTTSTSTSSPITLGGAGYRLSETELSLPNNPSMRSVRELTAKRKAEEDAEKEAEKWESEIRANYKVVEDARKSSMGVHKTFDLDEDKDSYLVMRGGAVIAIFPTMEAALDFGKNMSSGSPNNPYFSVENVEKSRVLR